MTGASYIDFYVRFGARIIITDFRRYNSDPVVPESL